MLFAKRPSQTGPITLSCTKQKDAEEFKSFALRLKLVPEVDSCVVEGPRETQKSYQMQALLRILREHGALTWNDWCAIAIRHGMSKTAFYRYFEELKKIDEIVKKNKKWRLSTEFSSTQEEE